jgi:hypothetical protein
MDYLDASKEFRQHVLLLIGYVLIALAIVTTTMLLVYSAYGYNLTNGNLIQEGLVFFSSHPNPASIYVNGKLSSSTTDTRLFLPSGIYHFEVTKTGYRDWKRTVTVDGGAVEHFDYPFLVPDKLTTKKIETYASAPGLMTESDDQNWILVQKPGSLSGFDLYNISSPAKPVETNISIPDDILGKATTSESWQLISWADDNKHILLEHIYDGKAEYVLVDRSDPAQSVNLTNTYNAGMDTFTLNNDKYNSYYIYDSTSGDLMEATSGSTAMTTVAQHVLAYKSYSNNTVLYATTTGAAPGEVLVKMLVGTNTYIIRSLPVSSTYLLNLTTYSGTLYVAIGSNEANRIYIYQDPVSQLTSGQGNVLVPVWVLNVNQANFLSFSNSAQFIMAENGTSYAVYDIENNLGYSYTDPKQTLDAPQINATWMDGNRIDYVSNGKLVIQDYDNNNRQALLNASPNYLPSFSSNYNYLYTLVPSAVAGQYDLDETPLLNSADL